jgi:hypothetical protein
MVWFVEKGAGKTTVTVTVSNLPDRAAADAAKAAWGKRLAKLAEMVK